jgi:hypothetical protein
MKTSFIAVMGVAQAETPHAFCVKDAKYALDGVGHEISGDTWIPLANIMSESHDTIEEAERGEEVEIFVAKWWLKEK